MFYTLHTPMTKEELQAVYFGFYDQLNEPERSEAKENWDWEFAHNLVPTTLMIAIHCGFEWIKSPQGNVYWSDIYGRLFHETYFATPDLALTLNNLSDQETTAYIGIQQALRSAETKHPNWPEKDLFKQYTILSEEVGEVAKAMLEIIDGDGSVKELREELYQSGAMIVRILKHLKE